jgi:tetratricopeptide (TPR) repeat protein
MINDYYQKGILALANQDYQEALNLFRRSLEKDISSDKWIGVGKAFFNLSNWDGARWAFYKALDLSPNRSEILILIEQTAAQKKLQTFPAMASSSYFRSFDNHIEIQDNGWKPFPIYGVNIGLGIPGYFPGEYAIGKTTYKQWFASIAEIGFNSIRIYTLHPPAFYEALFEFNAASQKKLYFFQEIWLELPEKREGDFNESSYMSYVKQQIQQSVDAINGHLSLDEKPGYPHGIYRANVSQWLIGYLLGREWESCAITHYNALYTGSERSFAGEYLSIDDGTPFEVWITKRCDDIQKYEHAAYKVTHPVSTINWPTLDPLTHLSEAGPCETARFQGFSPSCNHCRDEDDKEVLDLRKVTPLRGSGFFASYHVYPYHPDFLMNDFPHEDGYDLYCRRLKEYHKNQPVVIAEYGIPSSRNSGHWNPSGYHQGGLDEETQAQKIIRLSNTLEKHNFSGMILFSWFDEWCKKHIQFFPYLIPFERKSLWFNSLDPEESFGIMGMYPGYPKPLVTLDAKSNEWNDAVSIYHANDSKKNQFQSLLMQHDEGFLYLKILFNETMEWSKDSVLIGLNLSNQLPGEKLLPLGVNLISPIDLHFIVHIDKTHGSRLLIYTPLDRYLNTAQTFSSSEEGLWSIILHKSNERRVSKNGATFYPSYVYNAGKLIEGSLNPKHKQFNSRSDFYSDERSLEIRLPWHLIHFSDPSSRQILGSGHKPTLSCDAIQTVAVVFEHEQDVPTAKQIQKNLYVTDVLPKPWNINAIGTYRFYGWNAPSFHMYEKPAASHLREWFRKKTDKR